MKKRVLSLFLALTLCLTLLPTSAFAEAVDGGTVSSEAATVEGGQPAAAGVPAEDNGQSNNTGEGEQPNSEADTRTEIWCKSKPDSIGRGYDGTTDGSTIKLLLTFTDGTNEFEFKEGTDFTAVKTFDSADAGWHTVTVEITLIGEAAAKYKLKAGEEKFEIGGYINKAYPKLTVSLSRTTCAVGEKLLQLLSVDGVQEDAAVTYYYTPIKSGYLEFEGSDAVPKIDENTAISEIGTYYVYAKTAETKNYEEQRSTTVELTVAEKVDPVASLTAADGTETTYDSFTDAWTAAIASEGSTLKLPDNVDIGKAEDGLSVDSGKFTLDLNGKTLSGNAYRQLIAVSGTADITIQNGKLVNTFSKDQSDINLGNANAVNIAGGKVVLENVEVTSGRGKDGAQTGAVYVYDGSLTVTSGTFTGVIGVVPQSPDAHPALKITSATLHNGIGYLALGSSVFDYDGVRALFASGSMLFDKDGKYIDIAKAEYWVSVGAGEDAVTEFAYSEESMVKPHTHTIVNGKCECGYICNHKNADGSSAIGTDGKCTVCGTQLSAAIGETYYADVKSALDAATDGQTVKLLANGMLDNDTYVSTTLTLDLNGHGLSGYSLNVGGLTATSQPRTGKLTVIDSSNGNGAVGVTVRDGGTLVFDPKNDSTNLLQLEVYGGTVQLYGGKISRQGLNLQNEIVLGDLLPKDEGFAYYRADSDTQLTLEEAASQTCDLVVKACSHGGTNGFTFEGTAYDDLIRQDTCPYCGASAVACAALSRDVVGEGFQWRKFVNLQDALDAARDGGSTLYLLTDVSGNYTISGTQNTSIELNGHSIKGGVDVNAVAEGKNYTTTFSNTQNTTTASITEVTAHSGAKLAGSGYPAVIGKLWLADTTYWEYILSQPDRLGFKVLNDDGTHKWYAPTDKSMPAPLENVIINSLPITFKSLSFKVNGKNVTGNKVERGTTVQLCANCNTKDAEVTIYIGEIVGNNEPTYSKKQAEYKKIGSMWYYVVDLPCNTIGKYSVSFTATKDGYTVTSNTKTLTVTKASIPGSVITAPTAKTLTYNGSEQALITAGGVDAQYGTMQYSLSSSASFSTEIPTKTDVGTYTVYYKVVGAEGYKDTTAKPIKVTISPIKIDHVMFVNDVTKTYSGSAEFSLITAERYNCLKFYGEASSLIDVDPGDYAINGKVRFLAKNAEDELVDSPEAGKKSYMQFTVELHSKNYVLQTPDGTAVSELTCIQSGGATFTITKATAPAQTTEVTLYVTNGLAKTYEVDLATLLPKLTMPCEYGDISYTVNADGLNKDYYTSGATVESGKLRLPILANNVDTEGSIGNVPVKVTTTNYEDITLTIPVFARNKLTPNQTDVTVSALDITYGDSLAKSKLTVTGKMKDPNTGAEVKGTFAWKDGTIKPNANKNYRAEWTFTPAEGYEEYATATGTVKVTVDPKSIEGATVTLKESSFVYDGTKKTPTKEDVTVVLDGVTLEPGSDKDYGFITSTASEVGTYNFTVIGNHNYTGRVAVQWSITPRTVTPTITVASCTYTGNALEPTVILTDDLGNTIDPKEYEVAYSNNTNVGTGTVAIKDVEGGNYVLSEVSQTFEITKAAAPAAEAGSLTITNGLHKTYSFDLSTLLPKLTAPCDYGKITYDKKIETNLGVGAFITLVDGKTGKLTLEVFDRSSKDEGQFGTITVTVSTGNYQDITLTINVIAENKIVPQVDGAVTATDITYGQALNDSKITGKMKDGNKVVDGTFTWVNGTDKPNANDSYQATWKFMPNDTATYAEVTGTVTIKVNKATPTGAPNYTKITTGGKTLADAAMTIEGSTLNPNDGELEWVDDKGNVLSGNTVVEANTTYQWHFTPTDTNYTTLTGEIELYHKSSGGGSSGYSYYSIKATAGTGGSISPSGNVSVREGRDQTFTITPDKGYAVSNVKIDGKSIGAVKSYTFESVSRTHTIEVIFMKANGNPQTGVFVDVATGSYYEDAVDWAVENDITQGTDNTHFSPDGICTRAQAVTFLWRAAGSPEPKANTMSFTDVNAGSYYYDAVLWAVENGITKGTSDTTFSPNMTCSRAQIVTFLWRSEKSPAAGTANPFADVKSTAYYADAVLWAVKEDITKGTTNTTFSPDADCTRAQIVTFLWRCKK